MIDYQTWKNRQVRDFVLTGDEPKYPSVPETPFKGQIDLATWRNRQIRDSAIAQSD